MCNYTMTNSIKVLLCLSALLSAISLTTVADDAKSVQATTATEQAKPEQAKDAKAAPEAQEEVKSSK